MDDYAEVKRQVEAVMKNAGELMRRDARIRSMVAWSAVEARRNMSRSIDPDNAEEEAFRLAESACALLAARIYTEDAEIAALKEERDRYKKLAEESLMMAPPRLLVPKTLLGEE